MVVGSVVRAGGGCRYDPGLNYGANEHGEFVFGYLGKPHEEAVRDYLLCLVLCNTVLVEELDNGEIKYGPESPDDGALVKVSSCTVDLGVVANCVLL